MKYRACCFHACGVEVAPFTGAWIEINMEAEKGRASDGRPLHGGVD